MKVLEKRKPSEPAKPFKQRCDCAMSYMAEVGDPRGV